jgi:hypothetical protein
MTSKTEAQIEATLDDIRIELIAAYENFPDFRSAHEGVAIIDEEMCEFKEAAYWPHKFPDGAEETEATQLAAMAVRYIVDVCIKEDTPR